MVQQKEKVLPGACRIVDHLVPECWTLDVPADLLARLEGLATQNEVPSPRQSTLNPPASTEESDLEEGQVWECYDLSVSKLEQS